jgi:hypothetical protein
VFVRRDIDAVIGKLDAFRGCFSKPQWRHFNTYMGGLVYGERGEKNIADIADNVIGGRDQSCLNRFITQPKWDIRKVDNIRQSEFIGKRVGGVLSLDDSILDKWGTNMEGVGYLYDTSVKDNVLCHNIVSTFYSNVDCMVPINFELYLKKETADILDLWFKTKVQIGIELLEKALIRVQPEAIVFDSWYFSKELATYISSRNLTWVTMAKLNRLVFVSDEWCQLSKFWKTIPKDQFTRINVEIDEKRFKWYYETIVAMKNVEKVKIVLLKKRKNSRKCTVLVSNNLEISGLQILKYYKSRWNIEVFYRDCKQHLGMGEYQTRKLDAVVIHLHLVFLAYTLLKNVWYSPILKQLLRGIRRTGTACKRLKKYLFEVLTSNRKLATRAPV